MPEKEKVIYSLLPNSFKVPIKKIKGGYRMWFICAIKASWLLMPIPPK